MKKLILTILVLTLIGLTPNAYSKTTTTTRTVNTPVTVTSTNSKGVVTKTSKIETSRITKKTTPYETSYTIKSKDSTITITESKNGSVKMKQSTTKK